MYYVIDSRRRVYGAYETPRAAAECKDRVKADCRAGRIRFPPDPATIKVVFWEPPTNVQQGLTLPVR